MDSSSSTGSVPVPTRACALCARAKAKCLPSQQLGGKCQRCDRLQKSCEPLAARVRAPKRKASDSARLSKQRVEKLEEKLDDLVTLLKSSKDVVSPLAATSTSVTLSENHSPTSSLKPCDLQEAVFGKPNADEVWEERLDSITSLKHRFGLPIDPKTDPNSPFFAPPAADNHSSTYQLGEIDLGEEDPEVLLSIFRDEMSPNFPFAIVPTGVLAKDLRRGRPSWYTAIMAVTSRNTKRQAFLGNIVMQQLAERVVVNVERNIDLLLAILTYMGWNYYLFLTHQKFTTLLTLGLSIVADMGLRQTPPKEMNSPFAQSKKTPEEQQRTDEERRAMLGYWFLNSQMSVFFRKLESLPWTPYLELCCDRLQAGSLETDKTVVTLLRLQLITERIAQSPWHSKFETKYDNIAPILHVRAVQEQIKIFRSSMPSELHDQVSVQLCLYNTEGLLTKIGLSKNPAFGMVSNRDFSRLELLVCCLQSVKSFLDIFLAIPVEKFHCLTTTMYTQLTWNIAILQMLTTFEHSDWDLNWARSECSIFDVLDRLADRFGQAKFVLSFDPHTSDDMGMFLQIHKKITWIKTVLEKSGSFEKPAATDTREFTNNDDTAYLPDLTEFLEEPWWMQDVLFPGEVGFLN